MTGLYVPERGDLVWLSFDPQSGHEQAGRRPALVLTRSSCNRRSGFAIVCPITRLSRDLPASAGRLDNPVSRPWLGLAVRLTRRPRQRGQYHTPTGSVLGRLDQEFPQRDIDVDIVELVVEGGLHVGRTDEARRRVVLASHTPEFIALGKSHPHATVAASNGAFDLDLSGHSPNVTTIEQGDSSDSPP